MKTLTILWATILMASNLYSQDAKEVLLKSRTAMSQIDNGYYEMDQYFKFLTHKDTIHRIDASCYFMRTQDDTLSDWNYLYRSNSQNNGGFNLYDGTIMVNGSGYDSIAQIVQPDKWPDVVKSFANNMNGFYKPIMDSTHRPLPPDSLLDNTTHTYQYIDKQSFQDRACYLIRSEHIPLPSEENMGYELLKEVTDYWIDSENYILLQFTHVVDLVIDVDTMLQYERCAIRNYKFNHLTDKAIISIDSLPDFYVMRDYVPPVREEPQLLEIGTQAPTWKFETLTDDSLSLEDLKGKLVILDFFYKSCYPCMKSIPALQSVYDKYKHRGVVVVGVNPMDDKIEDELVPFMAKRGVTYPVVMANRDFAKSYTVSAYPSIYILDGHGQIIHHHIGYSPTLEQDLEDVILKILDDK
jgi:peroxiredoxin